MQCPTCGYVLADLETECRRCKRKGAPAVAPPLERVRLTLSSASAEKECPRCGKATEGDAAVCDKCHYEFQPDSSRSERYQALMVEEARSAPPPSTLRRTVPPVLSWSVIGASLLAIGVAGWVLFGGIITGEDYGTNNAAPIVALHPHKSHHAAARVVTYKVTGTAAQALVTTRGADGVAPTSPLTVSLPWTQSFKARTGASLAVSAKSVDSGGTVVVEIDVDGVPQKQVPNIDADGLATLSETL